MKAQRGNFHLPGDLRTAGRTPHERFASLNNLQHEHLRWIYFISHRLQLHVAEEALDIHRQSPLPFPKSPVPAMFHQ